MADASRLLWAEYRDPVSHVARAIQMPLYPTDRWVNGVINGYLHDARDLRAPTLPALTGDRHE